MSSLPPNIEPPDYTPVLQQMMQAAGLTSFAALSRQGISREQVRQVRRGEILQLRVKTLVRLAEVLQVSLPHLLEQCSPLRLATLAGFGDLATQPPNPANSQLQQEYQRLQTQLQTQQQRLQQEFQQQALQTLEPFLTYWPTAAHAARQSPTAPAVNLLPLARPVEQLLQTWGVEPIGEVGATLAFDPQQHQLLTGGDLTPGSPVVVAHLGYRQGERLLFRAKVKTHPPC